MVLPDGNGRIVRFIMFKQCIENELDLLLIDDQFSFEYKKALYKAQSQDDYSELIDVFKQCKKLFDQRLSFLKETLDYMRNHEIKITGQFM